jgi:S1-C subfamily serine protease
MLYDFEQGRQIELSSLLINPSQTLPLISQICRTKLKAEGLREGWADLLWIDDPAMDADPIKEVRKAQNWHFNLDGVEILFGEYTIGPYVLGMRECTLMYPELASWINPNGELAHIARLDIKPTPREPVHENPAEPPPVRIAAPVVPKTEPKRETTGTAFAINSAGEAVTNYHVVRECSIVKVLEGKIRRGATVVASDEQNDLAVLRVKDAQFSPLRFRDGSAIRPADQVVALGFPYAGLLTTSLQVTTGTVSALSGIRDDTRYLQLTAPVQPGNSGGPLLDLSGNVVGVVSGRLDALLMAKTTGTLPENVNFAIKSGIVRGFLEAKGIDYVAAKSVTKVEAADVGEAASKSVFMVECE